MEEEIPGVKQLRLVNERKQLIRLVSDDTLINWIDERTVLVKFDYEKRSQANVTDDPLSEFLIIAPLNFPVDAPVLALHPFAFQALHCPTDLKYSENKENLRKFSQNPAVLSKQFIPVEIESITRKHWLPTLTFADIVATLRHYFKSHSHTRSPLHYFPGIRTWSAICLLFLLNLICKATLTFNTSNNSSLKYYHTLQSISLQSAVRDWYSSYTKLKNQGHFIPPLAFYLQYALGAYFQDSEDTLLDQSSNLVSQEQFNEELQHLDFEVKSVPSQEISEEFEAQMRLFGLLLDCLCLFSATIVFGLQYWKRLHPKLRFSAIFMLLFSPTLVLTNHGIFSLNFMAMGLILFSVTAALSSYFTISGALFICAVFLDHNWFFLSLPLLTLASTRSFNIQFLRSTRYEPSFILEIVGRGKLGLILSKSFDFAGIAVSILLPAFIILFPFLQYPSYLSDLFSALFLSPPSNPLPLNFWTLFAPKSLTSNTFTPTRIIAPFLWILSSLPALLNLIESPYPRRFILTISICSISYTMFAHSVETQTILFPLISAHLLLFQREGILTTMHLITLFTLRSQFKAANLHFFYIMGLVLITLLFHQIQSKLPACDDNSRLRHSSFITAVRDAISRRTLTSSLLLNLPKLINLVMLIMALVAQVFSFQNLVPYVLFGGMFGVFMVLNAKLRIVEEDPKTVIDPHSFTYSYELKFE